jgi:hypothetical protein
MVANVPSDAKLQVDVFDKGSIGPPFGSAFSFVA